MHDPSQRMPSQQVQFQQTLPVSPISLPKGGGAHRSIESTLTAGGPDGAASLTLPLPLSTGRGYAPSLALHYHSSSGNGLFGIGWQLTHPAISRRTDNGVPAYDHSDQFLGPNGTVLVPERDQQGTIITRICQHYGDITLTKNYTVTRYFPRVEGPFDRIEQWQESENSEEIFWLLHGADGQLHAYGKQAQARVTHGDQIAQWLLEESVSPTGEHIAYAYRPEDAAGIDVSGQEGQRQRGALHHLIEVCYGNATPASALYLWQQNPLQQRWHFRLVFDYGERGLDSATAPPYQSTAPWLARQDPYSGYHYGFETRCHRLCRQIMMYHQFDALGNQPYLVNRLLLDYDHNPIISQLIGARLWAYANDGIPLSLPPLEWRYTAPAISASTTSIPAITTATAADWHPWQGLPGLDNGQPWQLVDLYGEGLPGLLYRAGNGWHYCAPIRDSSIGASQDAVSYDSWQTVPIVPTLTEQALLMDTNADGKLEWVITQPEIAGFFSLNPDRSVSAFTPFAALPNEFFHPQAQLADLMGAGRVDIALIGPRSVRLYANQDNGFDTAREWQTAEGVTLPAPGQDATALIAFADLLGSGQQHLVEIRANRVRCWPNLGRGRFGLPLELAPLEINPADFNPEHLYLADLDGSGTVDLILALGDRLRIYRNQAGNGFARPIELPLPANYRFDQFKQLTIADITGQGIASLILTSSLAEKNHWRYDFCQQKPYLLAGSNNNHGADCQLFYRSSAQHWLDEKAAGVRKICQLPFPIHTLTKVMTLDEISGNRLSQIYRYYHGVYDGQEHQFLGFGMVESTESTKEASATAVDITFTPSLLIRSWYHTGESDGNQPLADKRWQGDVQAFQPGSTRLTAWNSQTEQEIPLPESTDNNIRAWMQRALAGRIVRQERFGLDGGPQAANPYDVTQYRYQVRLIQASYIQNRHVHSAPVVLPQLLEQLHYQYERIPVDPQCHHQIMLASTGYGQPTYSVTLCYPRRPAPALSPYPKDLPPASVAHSYDPQQQRLQVNELKQSYHQLCQPAVWQLGIPDTTRQNRLQISADKVPASGFSFEKLSEAESILTAATPRIYAGQQQILYRQQPPDRLPVLTDHIETAELDSTALTAYKEVLSQTELTTLLTEAGYQQRPKLLSIEIASAKQEAVWIKAHSYTCYQDNLFYLPISQQSTQLTGALTLRYDSNGLLASSTDALGNQVTILKRDYRFLLPIHLRDANDNESQIVLDALGNPIASWFYGTENGQAQPIGFNAPSTADRTRISVLDLLTRTDTPLTVATYQAWSPFSWMAQIDANEWQKLPDAKQLTEDLLAWHLLVQEGSTLRLTARGARWLKTQDPLAGLPAATEQALRQLLSKAVPIPPHAVTLQPDRYPDASYYHDGLSQQIQVVLHYYDGFGRNLQTVTKVESGLAYQRTAEGELAVDTAGKPIEASSSTRWAISGRVEYDNKGQPVRQFQPYFIDNWNYVSDRSLRACGYADLHYYDPLGRLCQVETAKKQQRRSRYYPWFRVAEDENDLQPPSPTGDQP